MCRIMGMAGVKKEKQKLMWDFLMKARPLMTASNKDGVGYAALGEKGIWGERWLNPEDSWLKESRRRFTQKDKEFFEKFKGSLEHNIKYNCFGDGAASGNNSAVIYHSRASTNVVCMENVHPFVRENTALIHNGIIRNADKLKMVQSTCDSEAILNEYVDENVTTNVDNIEKVSQALQGYYGCAVLTVTNEGKRYLDIFRHGAPIFVSFIEQLGAPVFCTDADIIRETCKELKLTHQHMFKVKDDTYLRFDADSGMLLFTRKLKPNENWTSSGNYSHGYHNTNNNSSSRSATAGESNTTSATKDGEADTSVTATSNTEGAEKKSPPALTIVPISEDLTQEATELTRSLSASSSAF